MNTSEIAEQVRMCAACPKLCRHVCPTFFAWRSDSPTPHGRALLIHQHLTGTRSVDERAVEVIYQCLECSNCLVYCLPEIDIASIVEEFRTELVKEHNYPKGLRALRDSIKQKFNPYNEPQSERTAWMTGQKISGGRVLYFVGCTASYREQNIARDTVALLEKMSFGVRLMEEEHCCGSPLFRTGFVDDALELARHNVSEINSMDIDEVVVTCPGCYRVLTQDYPKHGIEIHRPVYHITQFLKKHLNRVPRFESDETVTYHDPCHLGRHCDVYDEPREVIAQASGKQVVEMARNRENAMCCGNGAGMRTLFSDRAKTIADERIQQALVIGAKYLVTACPFCKNLLHSQSKGKIEVLDLPEFLMRE